MRQNEANPEGAENRGTEIGRFMAKKDDAAVSFLVEESKGGAAKVKWCAKTEFLRGLLEKFSKEDSGCIMRLFFSPRKEYEVINRIRHFYFLCDTSEAGLFERNIRMLAKTYGLKRDFGEYFSVKEKEGMSAFISDVAAYRHIVSHPEVFALLKLDLKYKNRVENCLGPKFDPQRAINPETNAFHPDAMTREQKIRWSC